MWAGTEPIAYTYQWQRCDASGGNCGSVAGATNRTYVVTAADVSRSVRVISPRGTRRCSCRNVRFDERRPTGRTGGSDRAAEREDLIPIESMALPARLVIDEVVFSPNPVRSRSTTITARVHVADTRGFVVRGALVYMRSLPLLTTTPPEAATATDGYVTFRMRPLAPRPALVFPLRRGVNLQFTSRRGRPGSGCSTGSPPRLTQVHTMG